MPDLSGARPAPSRFALVIASTGTMLATIGAARWQMFDSDGRIFSVRHICHAPHSRPSPRKAVIPDSISRQISGLVSGLGRRHPSEVGLWLTFDPIQGPKDNWLELNYGAIRSRLCLFCTRG